MTWKSVFRLSLLPLPWERAGVRVLSARRDVITLTLPSPKGRGFRREPSVTETLLYCALLICYAMPTQAEETCEGGHLIPAQYEEREIEVQYEAHNRLIVVPATYRTITQEVVVAEAHCPSEALKSVTQTVLVEEPSESIQVVPTRFERTEDNAGKVRMIVKQPAFTRRVAVTGYLPKITRKFRDPDAANNDCTPDDMIPAITRSVKRRVVDTPASIRSERVLETVRTITEKILVSPARCEQNK